MEKVLYALVVLFLILGDMGSVDKETVS